MVQRFFIVPVLAGTLLFPVACATKKFVREEVGRLKTDLDQEKERVNQVDSKVEGVTVQTRQVETQVTDVRFLADEARSRSDQARSKALEATGLAGQAMGKAVDAMARAEGTDSRLTRFWSDRNRRSLVDSLTVGFGFDRWELDDRAETTLVDFVRQMKENSNLVLDLEGYTDRIGPREYNLQLSQRRVDAVRRFLVQKGIDIHRIHSIGLGPASAAADDSTKEGKARNRRVTIKLFLLGESSATSEMPQTAPPLARGPEQAKQ